MVMAGRGSRSPRRIVSLVALAMTLGAVLVPTLSNMRSTSPAEARSSTASASSRDSSGASGSSASPVASPGSVSASASVTSASVTSASSASASLALPKSPLGASNRADPRLRRIGFASARGLDSHWLKHGSEFNVSSKAEYLAMAQELRDAPLSGNVIEAPQSNGSYARFDRRSGAFLAFNRDLTIRTFFRPDDGEAYFRRAVNRR